MLQKKSVYGNINIAGRRGAASSIFSNQMPGFLDEIEDGIRPVVEACMGVGLDTFSSCEGHAYPGEPRSVRFVDIVVERWDERRWAAFLCRVARDMPRRFEYTIFSFAGQHPVMNHHYRAPVRLKILFPQASSDAELDRLTKALAAAIRSREYPGESSVTRLVNVLAGRLPAALVGCLVFGLDRWWWARRLPLSLRLQPRAVRRWRARRAQ